MIKPLAAARGLSEAEVIRQAVDREASHATTQLGRGSQDAWVQAHAFMLSLLEHAGKSSEPYIWNRGEAYESRLGRYSLQDKPSSEGSTQE